MGSSCGRDDIHHPRLPAGAALAACHRTRAANAEPAPLYDPATPWQNNLSCSAWPGAALSVRPDSLAPGRFSCIAADGGVIPSARRDAAIRRAAGGPGGGKRPWSRRGVSGTAATGRTYSGHRVSGSPRACRETPERAPRNSGVRVSRIPRKRPGGVQRNMAMRSDAPRWTGGLEVSSGTAASAFCRSRGSGPRRRGVRGGAPANDRPSGPCRRPAARSV